jgi:hypothetical protein
MPNVCRDRGYRRWVQAAGATGAVRDRQPVGRYPSSRTIIPSIKCYLNEDAATRPRKLRLLPDNPT